MYGKITDLLPYDPVSHFNRAAALARIDREEEALEELRLFVEYGWADTDGLRSDPAFSKIRGTTEFKELLNRAKEIADEPIVVYMPQGLDGTTEVPLIISFHGKGRIRTATFSLGGRPQTASVP